MFRILLQSFASQNPAPSRREPVFHLAVCFAVALWLFRVAEDVNPYGDRVILRHGTPLNVSRLSLASLREGGGIFVRK